MSIPYNYEIINVNPQARVMEVVYTSPGRQTMHIGARLPYQGEATESVVQMYAPVAYWMEQEAEVVIPELGSGVIEPQSVPQPDPLKAFTAAIQERLDAFASTRNYDGILSACTYATSSVPKFRAEGQYAVDARDNTWAAAYQILAEVQSGTRPMPASPEDIFPELPQLAWPT